MSGVRRSVCVLMVAVAACLAQAAPSSATDFKIQYVCNDRGVTYPVVGARVSLFKREDGQRYLWGGNLIKSVLSDEDGRATLSVGGSESNFFLRLTLNND